jgi:hypothetical protein
MLTMLENSKDDSEFVAWSRLMVALDERLPSAVKRHTAELIQRRLMAMDPKQNLLAIVDLEQSLNSLGIDFSPARRLQQLSTFTKAPIYIDEERYAEYMRELVRKIPPSQAESAARQLIEGLAGPNSSGTTGILVAGLEVLIPSLSPQETENILEDLLRASHGATALSCGAAAPLLSKQTLPQALDLLKWPTCVPPDRNAIISQFERIFGQRFGIRDADGSYHPDAWHFVAWLSQKGFDFQSPPQRPVGAILGKPVIEPLFCLVWFLGGG